MGFFFPRVFTSSLRPPFCPRPGHSLPQWIREAPNTNAPHPLSPSHHLQGSEVLPGSRSPERSGASQRISIGCRRDRRSPALPALSALVVSELPLPARFFENKRARLYPLFISREFRAFTTLKEPRTDNSPSADIIFVKRAFVGAFNTFL